MTLTEFTTINFKCLTETSSRELMKNVVIGNFQLSGCFCRSFYKGAGAAIFVNRTLNNKKYLSRFRAFSFLSNITEMCCLFFCNVW